MLSDVPRDCHQLAMDFQDLKEGTSTGMQMRQKG